SLEDRSTVGENRSKQVRHDLIGLFINRRSRGFLFRIEACRPQGGWGYLGTRHSGGLRNFCGDCGSLERGLLIPLRRRRDNPDLLQHIVIADYDRKGENQKENDPLFHLTNAGLPSHGQRAVVRTKPASIGTVSS